MRASRFSLAGMLCLLVAAVLPPAAAAQGDERAPTVAPAEVTVIRDVVHATGSKWDEKGELKLDLYLAARDDAPVVVHINGACSPRQHAADLAQALAERGVSVILADCPFLTPEGAFADNAAGVRAQLESVACAVRFARGSEYGSETAPLVLSGYSLGGGLAAHVALSGEDFDRRWEAYAESGGGPPRQLECTVTDGSTRVDALVGIGGAYDGLTGFDGFWEYGMPFALAHEPDYWEFLQGIIGLHPEVRARLLHGKSDLVLAYKNSVLFEALLAHAGNDVELIPFDGGHKAPDEVVAETVLDLLGE